MSTPSPPPPPAHRLEVPLTPPQAVPHLPLDLSEPAADRGGPVVVLAHGAGGGPDAPDLLAVTAAVVEAGYPVARFAFPYRVAGRRSPDPASRLIAAWRDVLAVVRAQLPGRPVVAGGRSMGGRLASVVAADGAECVAGLALLAYPLRSSTPRTDHWPRLAVPVLFVSGDRDALCDLDQLRLEINERLTVPVTLRVVKGGDHAFRVRKRNGRSQREVYAEVAGAVREWVVLLHAGTAAR